MRVKRGLRQQSTANFKLAKQINLWLTCVGLAFVQAIPGSASVMQRDLIKADLPFRRAHGPLAGALLTLLLTCP
jgi:hypothetical protein